MPISLLSDAQRTDLHEAIIGYLGGLNKVSPAILTQLRSELGVSEGNSKDSDAQTLERKWVALVRLQRKLLEVEAQNTSLKQALEEVQQNSSSTLSSRPTHASSIDNWLPRWPPKYKLEGHRGRVTSVAFHPKWTIVASGSDDGTIKIWDYESGELERTIKAHTRSVLSVTFSPISRLLVSCSADLSVRVWDPAKEFTNTLTLVGHNHTISAVTVVVDPSNDKEYVASGSRDKTIRLWDLETGFVVRVIQTHTDWVRALDATSFEASPQQQQQQKQQQYKEPAFLLSAGSDRSVRLTPLFDSIGDDSTMVYEGHKNVIECCAIAPKSAHKFISKHHECQPDDIIFASGGRDSVILIWVSSSKEKPVLKLVGHDNWVQGLAFHPSGRFLVSVSDDKTLRIWDLAAGKLSKTIAAHDHFVTSIAWHGKTIATGSVDQSVLIWR